MEKPQAELPAAPVSPATREMLREDPKPNLQKGGLLVTRHEAPSRPTPDMAIVFRPAAVTTPVIITPRHLARPPEQGPGPLHLAAPRHRLPGEEVYGQAPSSVRLGASPLSSSASPCSPACHGRSVIGRRSCGTSAGLLAFLALVLDRQVHRQPGHDHRRARTARAEA